MNRKQTIRRNAQMFHIMWTFYAILFLSFSHNGYAQVHLDTNKIFTTEEDWSKSIDGLFHKGILDSTKESWVLLRFKINENGEVLSSHIVRSANIDPSMYYSICATIEDCYHTPFLKNEVKRYQDHFVNGFLYFSLRRRFPKRSGQGQEVCTDSSGQDKKNYSARKVQGDNNQ